ncbi:MAG: nuclear transport factor 2 family protein, partial [Deltaproteobacteria bacterium]|nr:nuclear transport factor 2 family protein [Deltaproteobacteria bacterium]
MASVRAVFLAPPHAWLPDQENQTVVTKGVPTVGELSDLERRIQRLEDIEAIRKLKINYWNSVDNKLWDELASCFAEESVLEV